MNSEIVLIEELPSASSIEQPGAPKYRMPYVPLMPFAEAATIAGLDSFTSAYFSYSVTAPDIELTFVQKQEIKRFSLAKPVLSKLEFESNPIVRVYPATGNHYPMKIVKRSAASFKPSPMQILGDEVNGNG